MTTVLRLSFIFGRVDAVIRAVLTIEVPCVADMTCRIGRSIISIKSAYGTNHSAKLQHIIGCI